MYIPLLSKDFQQNLRQLFLQFYCIRNVETEFNEMGEWIIFAENDKETFITFTMNRKINTVELYYTVGTSKKQLEKVSDALKQIYPCADWTVKYLDAIEEKK